MLVVILALICLAAVTALGGLALYARARLGAVEAQRDAAETVRSPWLPPTSSPRR